MNLETRIVYDRDTVRKLEEEMEMSGNRFVGIHSSVDPFDPAGERQIEETSLLPSAAAARKEVPIASGVFDYFPAALEAVRLVDSADDPAEALLEHFANRGGTQGIGGPRSSVLMVRQALVILLNEVRVSPIVANPKTRASFLDYFAPALIEVAKVSYIGNQQHNPGQPLHWARGKSMDQADTMLRHFTERGTIDTDGVRHSAKMVWRALAILQLELEASGAPIARGARLPEEG